MSSKKVSKKVVKKAVKPSKKVVSKKAVKPVKKVSKKPVKKVVVPPIATVDLGRVTSNPYAVLKSIPVSGKPIIAKTPAELAKKYANLKDKVKSGISVTPVIVDGVEGVLIAIDGK